MRKQYEAWLAESARGKELALAVMADNVGKG